MLSCSVYKDTLTVPVKAKITITMSIVRKFHLNKLFEFKLINLTDMCIFLNQWSMSGLYQFVLFEVHECLAESRTTYR